MDQSSLESLRRQIHAAQSIALVSHERPDGDAVGSLLAFSVALEKAGKRVSAHLVEGLPGSFSFLPGSELVESSLPDAADMWFFVDCSDADRSGFPHQQIPQPIDLNVDHHPTNTRFAKINIVDPQAASTTQLLFDLLPAMGLDLDTDVATNLLAGLVTDTIGFRTQNVTPQVLEQAAVLMRRGASLAELYERLLVKQKYVTVQYWGRGLDRMQRSDGVVWASLTLEDRHKINYPGSDDADLVNILSSIQDTQIAIVFVEQKGGKVKVSWRSRPEHDVSGIALSFGGGGHRQAAGATIEGALEEVQVRVLAATEALLIPQEA